MTIKSAPHLRRLRTSRIAALDHPGTAGREGRLRLGHRSWAGLLLRSLPLSSSPSGLRKSENPLPLHNQTHHLSCPVHSRGAEGERWADGRAFPNSWTLQGFGSPLHPTPRLQWSAAPRISKGFSARRQPGPRAKGAERRCAGGQLPRLHPLCQVPRSHPAAQWRDPGQGRKN